MRMGRRAGPRRIGPSIRPSNNQRACNSSQRLRDQWLNKRDWTAEPDVRITGLSRRGREPFRRESTTAQSSASGTVAEAIVGGLTWGSLPTVAARTLKELLG